MWITRSFKETDFWAQIKGFSKPTQESATKSTLNHPKEDKRTDAHTYPLKQSSKWTRLAAVRRRHNWKVRLYHVSRNIWSLRELPCPRYIRVYTMRCHRILNVWWIFRGKKEKSLARATVKINCARGMPHAYRIQAKILAEKMQKELFPPSFTER